MNLRLDKYDYNEFHLPSMRPRKHIGIAPFFDRELLRPIRTVEFSIK